YIRFLFIGSQFRSTLPLHARSPSRSCASLRSLWSACGGTFTHKSALMLSAQKIGHRTVAYFSNMLAERRGFEPRLGYEPKHAFQACDLNHSSISPDGSTWRCHEAAYYSKYSQQYKAGSLDDG